MLSGYFIISFVPGVQSGVTVKSMSMYFLNWAIKSLTRSTFSGCNISLSRTDFLLSFLESRNRLSFAM